VGKLCSGEKKGFRFALTRGWEARGRLIRASCVIGHGNIFGFLWLEAGTKIRGTVSYYSSLDCLGSIFTGVIVWLPGLVSWLEIV